VPDGARERRQRLRREGTLAEAQRCVFSGVPAATEMPSAKSYVRQYRATFGKNPGGLGLVHVRLRQDSLRSDRRAKSYDFAAVERQLRATKGYRGATGAITIDRKTGYRTTFRSASSASTGIRGSARAVARKPPKRMTAFRPRDLLGGLTQ
jgi:hypothetical protein